MAHEECFERQRPVGLLQFERKASDGVFAPNLVNRTVEFPEFFRVFQWFGLQSEVQTIKVRRRANGCGNHAAGSLDGPPGEQPASGYALTLTGRPELWRRNPDHPSAPGLEESGIFRTCSQMPECPSLGAAE
jgi:hypothetical protein